MLLWPVDCAVLYSLMHIVARVSYAGAVSRGAHENGIPIVSV